VVRSAERAEKHQRLIGSQPADGAVNASRFDALFGREVGKDRAQSLGQQCLSRSGTADHQQVMCAGRGDGDGPLGRFLAFDVGIIESIVAERVAGGRPLKRRGWDVELLGVEANRFRQ